MQTVTLPADSHVHSEWSWDTGGPASSAAGTMRMTCERAARIGLPAVAFTEHLDFDDAWRAGPEDFPDAARPHITAEGYLLAPPLDVTGYLESIDRCRHDFPDLHIMTGVEWGQPHLNEQRARHLLHLDSLDRINGSLHTLPAGKDRAEPITLYKQWAPQDVVVAYMEEVPRVVAGSNVFEVFTHIDYAIRHWPTVEAGPFDPSRFEEPIRVAMRAIADSGRALEMNTRRLQLWMPLWWRQEGGRAVTFGSDSHIPGTVGDGLPEAAALLEHVGFRPQRRPEDFWTC
jgi:histidinol-phosphatase (PHP family)